MGHGDSPLRRGRWTAVAAAVAVVAVLAGTQLHHAAPAPQPTSRPRADGVVPWAALPATHPDIPAVTLPPDPDPAVAAAAPACRASDLHVRRILGAGMGTAYLGLTLTLGGGRPCRLQGYPEIRLLDHGQPVDIPVERLADDSTYRDPVLVTASAAARLTLSWGSLWCTTPVHNDTVEAVLPDGGGTLRAEGFESSPFCNGEPGSGPVPIREQPFEPARSRPAEVRSAYASVDASGDLDVSTAPGEPVRFVVTLTTSHRLLLDPCPDYVVSQWVHASHEDRFALNCAAVPYRDAEGRAYLPAGHPVSFAMQATAGDDGGVGKLGWWLDTPDRAVMLGGLLTVADPAHPRT